MSDTGSALERASYVRLYRADIKRRLANAANQRAALHEAADLIDDPPEELDAMRVVDLLRSCRQMGRRSATNLMLRVGLTDPEKQIGRLSVAQRSRLVEVLRRQV